MVSVMQQFDEMLDPKKKKEGDQLTSESTSIDGGAPTATSPGAPAGGNYTKSTFQSPSKIMRANTQSSGVDLTGTYEDQANKVRTSLKSEKDANYTKLKDARVQPIDQGNFDAAVEGDEKAQGNVSNFLSGKFQKPVYESSVSTDINDLDSLQNSGGIAALLRNRGKENYTAGMANLDARLFQNNPMAGAQINKARDIARGVRKEGVNQKAQFEKDVGDAETEFTGSQKTLRDMLSGKRQSIQDKIKEQTSGRKQQRTSGVSDLDNVYNKVLSEGNGGQLNPRLMDALNKVDKSKFAGTDFAGEVVDGTQARQLNNIQRLLGEGGNLYSENTGNYEAAQGAGYEQALRDALTKFRDEEAARNAAVTPVQPDPTLETRKAQVDVPGQAAPGEFTPVPGLPVDFKDPLSKVENLPNLPVSTQNPFVPEARSPVADVRQPPSIDIGGVKVNANPIETIVSTASGGNVRTPTEILADILGQSPSKKGESNGMDALDSLGDLKPGAVGPMNIPNVMDMKTDITGYKPDTAALADSLKSGLGTGGGTGDFRLSPNDLLSKPLPQPAQPTEDFGPVRSMTGALNPNYNEDGTLKSAADRAKPAPVAAPKPATVPKKKPKMMSDALWNLIKDN